MYIVVVYLVEFVVWKYENINNYIEAKYGRKKEDVGLDIFLLSFVLLNCLLINTK